MTAKTIDSLEAWTAPATAAFEFWVSFFPTAPLFGVEWRFADWAGAASPFACLTATGVKRPVSAPMAKPVTIASKYAEAKEPPAKAAEKRATSRKLAAKAEASVPEGPARASRRTTARKAPASRSGKAPAVTDSALKGEMAKVETPVAAAPAPADDLKLIKGIGAGLEKQLNALGIRNFTQIAALSEKELAKLDAKLTTIKGRCFRDDWVGQAKALTA